MAYIKYRGDYTYLTIKDEYNRVRNHIYFIVARTGFGKGLFSERILEAYKSAGYTVICIADPKGEEEMAYTLFDPSERYHTRLLHGQGKPLKDFKVDGYGNITEKSERNVKLYHPFTFNIPKHKIPEMNLFTVPIKSLGRDEWSLIAETASDSDSIRLCLNASNNISLNDGVHAFLHYLNKIIKGKKGKKEIEPDPKNFYLPVTSGTPKSLQDIANYLQPFKKNYFLSKESCPYALDWVKLLNDNKNYHVFLNTWLGINPHDAKMKGFMVLYLLKKIIENRKKSDKPVIVFIPEVKYLMHVNARTPMAGYQYFLSKAFKESLSMIRSMGKGGMSAVLDTQSYSEVDEGVRRTSDRIFLGELSQDDIEKIGKQLQYRRDVKKLLSHMESQGSYLLVGHEDLDAFKMFLPSHAHCEEGYSFTEMYKQKYPERMISYYDMIKEKRKEFQTDEEYYKELMKKKADEEEKQEAKKVKDREKRREVSEKKSPIGDERRLKKAELIKLIRNKLIENPNLTPKQAWVLIGKERDQSTAGKWLREERKKLEEQNRQSDEVPTSLLE